LSYFAGAHINFVKNLGFNTINLLGFSQGALVAMAAATEAPRLGITVRSLAIGDPPNVVARSTRQLKKDIKSEKQYLKADVLSSKVEAAVRAHKLEPEPNWLASEFEAIKYTVAVLRKRKINLALVKHMRKDNFADRLADLLQTKPAYKPVIAYGDASIITPKEPLLHAIDRTILGFGRGYIELIEVEGAHHTWGDNIKLLARLCIKGFGW
jgi:thioesterase domain-containing protein